jgi:succinate dehydrogenase/fumarate reductase cytochrome b subunit
MKAHGQNSIVWYDEMKSEAGKALQAKLAPVGWLPVPVPYPYLQGLDWGKMREETGRGFGSMYLLGELRESGGFKGYYFFAYLFKEPLALQALLVLAVALYAARRRRFNFLSNEVVPAAAVAVYAVYLNFFFDLQIGIRHALVTFPVTYVFCGSLLAAGDEAAGRRPGARRAALPVLLAVAGGYLAVSVASYYPHYIPYFNELVWDRKQAYKILADSNLDWGQAKRYAQAYQAAHPEVYLEQGLWHMKAYRDRHMEEYLHPQFPASGRFVVNVNSYVGIYHPHRYKWLRERYRPVDHIAYAYLVFDVSPGDSAGRAGELTVPSTGAGVRKP